MLLENGTWNVAEYFFHLGVQLFKKPIENIAHYHCLYHVVVVAQGQQFFPHRSVEPKGSVSLIQLYIIARFGVNQRTLKTVRANLDIRIIDGFNDFGADCTV